MNVWKLIKQLINYSHPFVEGYSMFQEKKKNCHKLAHITFPKSSSKIRRHLAVVVHGTKISHY